MIVAEGSRSPAAVSRALDTLRFIAASIVRIEDGRLAEHWDVLQDEATQAESKSALRVFGAKITRLTEMIANGLQRMKLWNKHVSAPLKPIKVPGPEHPITIERNPNRVVVSVAGRIIAGTQSALTLREANYPPVHYIPAGTWI